MTPGHQAGTPLPAGGDSRGGGRGEATGGAGGMDCNGSGAMTIGSGEKKELTTVVLGRWIMGRGLLQKIMEAEAPGGRFFADASNISP